MRFTGYLSSDFLNDAPQRYIEFVRQAIAQAKAYPIPDAMDSCQFYLSASTKTIPEDIIMQTMRSTIVPSRQGVLVTFTMFVEVLFKYVVLLHRIDPLFDLNLIVASLHSILFC